MKKNYFDLKRKGLVLISGDDIARFKVSRSPPVYDCQFPNIRHNGQSYESNQYD